MSVEFYDHLEIIQQSLNRLDDIYKETRVNKEFTSKEHYQLKEKVDEMGEAEKSKNAFRRN